MTEAVNRDPPFPENVQFVQRDISNDCRRIAALVIKDHPNVTLERLLSIMSYQLGLAIGSTVEKHAVATLGARTLTECNYQFARGTIAAMTGDLT
jgi:hypothetical protein